MKNRSWEAVTAFNARSVPGVASGVRNAWFLARMVRWSEGRVGGLQACVASRRSGETRRDMAFAVFNFSAPVLQNDTREADSGEGILVQSSAQGGAGIFL
jgi:hypothetical protein